MTEKKTAKKKTVKPKVATIALTAGDYTSQTLATEIETQLKKLEETITRIRMRMSLVNTKAYQAGKVYRVPEDVPAETAASWLKSGAAEEDKSLDGPPETK